MKDDNENKAKDDLITPFELFKGAEKRDHFTHTYDHFDVKTNYVTIFSSKPVLIAGTILINKLFRER